MLGLDSCSAIVRRTRVDRDSGEAGVMRDGHDTRGQCTACSGNDEACLLRFQDLMCDDIGT